MIEKRGEFLEDGIPHVYADRIMAFPSKNKSILAFLPVKGWILVIFMMCLGISLKFILGIPKEFFASFYPGLGTALTVAGATFLSNWIKAGNDSISPPGSV